MNLIRLKTYTNCQKSTGFLNPISCILFFFTFSSLHGIAPNNFEDRIIALEKKIKILVNENAKLSDRIRILEEKNLTNDVQDLSKMIPEEESKVEGSIIPGISKDIYLYNMTELLETEPKIKKRWDSIMTKLYTDNVEKLEVTESDFDTIIVMLRSPETAENKLPLEGDTRDINFTKEPHPTDSRKIILKGIRVNYTKRNISIFKKTVTFKKK